MEILATKPTEEQDKGLENITFKKAAHIQWKPDEHASMHSGMAVFSVGAIDLTADLSTSTYAPLEVGTLYIGLRANQIESLFDVYKQIKDQTTSHKLRGDIYIPIAFLSAFAEDKIPIDKWPEPDFPHPHLPERLYNKAIRFSDLVQQNPGNDHPLTGCALWAPMRHSGGQLWFGQLKSDPNGITPPTTKQLKQDWTAALNNIEPFKPAVVKTRPGGISRAQKIILERPILFRLTALGNTRFHSQNQTATQFLEDKIAELNQKFKTSTGRSAAEIYPNKDPVDYQVLGKCPFHLYVSYISNDDHDLYMKDLLKGCYLKAEDDAKALKSGTRRNMRPLPSERPQRRAVLEGSVSSKNNLRGHFYGNGVKTPHCAKTPQIIGMTEINNSERRMQIKEGARKGEGSQKWGPKFSSATMHPPSLDDNPDIRDDEKLVRGGRKQMFDKCRTRVIARFTASRLDAAQKTTYNRSNYATQQTVVGGLSAPKTANEVLGWAWCCSKSGRNKEAAGSKKLNKLQMVNGLYIAEWLHMSGYAFGGLLDPKGDKDRLDVAGSSQIPENLVIGTSETNSVMTRYETAWQNLVKAERNLSVHKMKLRAKYAGETVDAKKLKELDKFGGRLIVTRHARRAPGTKPPKPVRNVDQQTNTTNAAAGGGSKIASEPMPAGGGSGIPRKPMPPDGKRLYGRFKVDSVKNGKFVVDEMEMDEVKQQIAIDTRWICYYMDWDIELTSDSKILKLGKHAAFGRTTFYPILRPLYHAMEAALDARLWKYMVKDAETNMKKDAKAEAEDNGSTFDRIRGEEAGYEEEEEDQEGQESETDGEEEIDNDMGRALQASFWDFEEDCE